MAGDLRLPKGAECLVILVHGSGGGHSNPRNQFIAVYLSRHGMGTLVVDLLTRTEQRWDNLTLVAAAHSGSVRAVVSRGGRTDLAAEALSRVSAPTLQVVASEDPMTLRLNVRTGQTLHCMQRLEVVNGATHLFKEPGALADVARLTADWFEMYLHKVPLPTGPLHRMNGKTSTSSSIG